jgi:hypothetical protein
MDLLCLAAIQYKDRLEFLDEVVALLNRRPSKAGVATVENLLAGPYPFGSGSPWNLSDRDPWAKMKAETNMGDRWTECR